MCSSLEKVDYLESSTKSNIGKNLSPKKILVDIKLGIQALETSSKAGSQPSNFHQNSTLSFDYILILICISSLSLSLSYSHISISILEDTSAFHDT